MANSHCCTLAARAFNVLPLKGLVDIIPHMDRWSDSDVGFGTFANADYADQPKNGRYPESTPMH